MTENLTAQQFFLYGHNSNADQMVIKLSYLGIQDKPVSSLLFSTRPIAEPLKIFDRFGLLYTNDDFEITTIILSSAELLRIMNTVERYSGKAVEDSATPLLGVAFADLGENRAAGYYLANTDTTAFFDSLRKELDKQQDIMTQFDSWRARTNL